MRIASITAVGIAVTTVVLIARHVSERDDSARSKTDVDTPSGGTLDPTPTPTSKHPQIKPGERLTISLIREPATHYSFGAVEDAYLEIATLAAAGRGHYDSALSRAAFEMAVQGALHRGVVPEPVTTFILHSSGAPDSSAARFSLRTNDSDEDLVARAIDEALSAPPSGSGELYFGIGEADTPSDQHSRHVVVLMSRRAFELEPAARSANLGSQWQLQGMLPAGYVDATAKALYPDGRLADATLEVRDRRFVLSLDTGRTPGRLFVGIDGVGESGPGKLLQISLEVGRPLPREISVTVAGADPPFATIEDAEAHAALLLAIDREQADAPALEIDPELTVIARAHSEEMAERGYFGHQSPTTGLVGDRIQAARYRASGFAENLAKNDSLAEAESSLLTSVGHRANLLGPAFTHVGVGLARTVERGQSQWYVTQLFATKTVEIDSESLVRSLYERVEQARQGAGLPSLEPTRTLESVAKSGAERAASGDTEDIASQLGRQASDAARRSVMISVQVVYNPEQIALPEAISDRRSDSVGIGVVQSKSDAAGRIGVVIITGR